jgi:cobalt-zinc-cadmium efflux system outer membrane protein
MIRILIGIASIAIFTPRAESALRFSDLAGRFFSDSDQSIVVEQDRERVAQEYSLALGSFYDPVLKASYFNQFRGYYINRRSDISLLQRTSLWGTQLLVGYRKGTGNYALYEGYRETEDQGEVRFGIEIPVLRNGFIDSSRGAIQKGEWAEELSKAQEKSQKLDLLRQLGVRYWDWFTQGRRLKVAEELLTLSVDRQDKIKVRVDRGDIARIELLEGDRIVLQRRAARALQERNFIKSKLDLEAFITSPAIEGKIKVDAAEIPDYAYPEASTLQRLPVQDTREIEAAHPESKRQDILLRQAQIDQKVARNQFLPKLDLSLNVSKDMGSYVKSLSPAENEAGVSFEFPIPSRAAQARKAQANTVVIRQEAQLDLTRVRIRNQIEEARNALNLSMDRMAIANRELELARELVKMENKRFLNGDSNLITLNIREQNLAEAEIRRFESYSEYRRSLNDYTVARGEFEWKD